MYPPIASEAPHEGRFLPAPASVRGAVLMMYAGAALSVIGTAAYLVAWYFGAYVITTRPSFVHGDSGLSITGSPVVAWFIGLAGLVVVVLWLLMARMCAHGQNWARIMSTILLALQGYALYGVLYAYLAGSRVSWTGLVPVVSFLVGLTSVILLWQRSSGRYFKATRSAR